MANQFTRNALARIRSVIAVSKRIKRELLQCGYAAPITVIPSPIDLTRFRLVDRLETRIQQFGHRGTEPWILFTTLHVDNPIKRTRLALEVMQRVRRKYPESQLRVASGVPHEQMPDFVSTCDLVLCTSHYEGWPNSVKEGLACGLPFVSTDVSDLADLALVHPECFAGDADPDVLSTAVLKALEPRSDGRERLRASVSHMSPECAAIATVEVYESLLNRR